MKSLLRIAISLLISVALFAGFAFVAYSGLFDYIETRFYDERVKATKGDEAQRIVEGIRKFHRINIDQFSSILDNDAIRGIYETNQSSQQLFEQKNIFATQSLSMSGFLGARFVDFNGDIHFTTFDSEIKNRSEDRIVLENMSAIADESELELYKIAEGQNSGIRIQASKGRLIYLLPAVDTLGRHRGTAHFLVSVRSLTTFLLADGDIELGRDFSLVENSGYIYNLDVAAYPDIIPRIEEIWQAAEAVPYASLAATTGEDELILQTDYDPELGFLGLVFPASELTLSQALRVLLLASFFLTTFLLVLLIINLRQDRQVILADRIKRFQLTFLREYLDNREAIDWNVWQREIGRRRNELTAEIKRGLGRIKKNESVDELINKSWDEILDVIGQRVEATPQIEVGNLEEIIRKVVTDEKLVSSIQSAARSQTPPTSIVRDETVPVSSARVVRNEANRPAAQTVPVSEPEEVEEIEELSELEEVEELEEVSAASAEEVEDLEEIEELSELEEVEELEEVSAASAEEVEDLEEIEELTELEEVEELEEVSAASAEEVDDLEEIEELPELEEVEELEEVSAASAEEIEEFEEIEELTELEEVVEASAEEVEDLEEIEELPELEEVEGLEEVSAASAEEVEDLEEIEELTELEEVEGLEEVSAASAEEVEDLEEIEELSELEEVEGLEEVVAASAEEVEDLEEIEELPELEEVEELEEVSAASAEEIEEFEEIEELTELEEVEELEEVSAASAEEVDDLEEIEELTELEEVEELEEVSAGPTGKTEVPVERDDLANLEELTVAGDEDPVLELFDEFEDIPEIPVSYEKPRLITEAEYQTLMSQLHPDRQEPEADTYDDIEEIDDDFFLDSDSVVNLEMPTGELPDLSVYELDPEAEAALVEELAEEPIENPQYQDLSTANLGPVSQDFEIFEVEGQEAGYPEDSGDREELDGTLHDEFEIQVEEEARSGLSIDEGDLETVGYGDLEDTGTSEDPEPDVVMLAGGFEERPVEDLDPLTSEYGELEEVDPLNLNADTNHHIGDTTEGEVIIDITESYDFSEAAAEYGFSVKSHPPDSEGQSADRDFLIEELEVVVDSDNDIPRELESIGDLSARINSTFGIAFSGFQMATSLDEVTEANFMAIPTIDTREEVGTPGIDHEMDPRYRELLEKLVVDGAIQYFDIEELVAMVGHDDDAIEYAGGVYQIRESVVQGTLASETSNREFEDLVDAVMKGDAELAESGIDSLLSPAISDFDIPLVDDSFEESVVKTKTAKRNENGRLSADIDGLRYDEYLTAFPDQSLGIYKSLIRLSGRINALACGILTRSDSCYWFSEAVGFEDDGTRALRISLESAFVRNILATHTTLYVRRHDTHIEEIDTAFGSGDLRYMLASLFVPIAYNGATEYLVFGLKDGLRDGEDLLRSLIGTDV